MDISMREAKRWFINQTEMINTMNSINLGKVIVLICLLSAMISRASGKPKVMQDSIVTYTRYSYDNVSHIQPTAITVSQSDGSEKVTVITYAGDYDTSTGPVFIKNMVRDHLLAYPIEKVTYRKMGGVVSILSGSVEKYKTENAALKEETLILENNSPLSATNFKFSNRSTYNIIPPLGTKSVYSVDNHYKSRVFFYDYDLSGNLLQGAQVDNNPICYIWNYNNEYPVAEIRGASLTDVAYTSFEADNKGYWSYAGNTTLDLTAPTGTRVYALSGGQVIKSGLDISESYLLTYWAKGGDATHISGGAATIVRTNNGWNFYSRKLSGTSTLTLAGTGIYLDEVRLCPANSTIITYTYEPLVGITSQADNGGRIIYYQYDLLNRLQFIRDMDGNILKLYDYSYKSPQ